MMSTKLNAKYVSGFLSEEEINSFSDKIKNAHDMLHNKTGEGSDFTGWVDLPVDYDKEEFARIKAAAQKIKKNSDVLIVIGIGGSYLGARAVIEFIKGQNYNVLRGDAPEIYFAGNTISPSSICELENEIHRS